MVAEAGTCRRSMAPEWAYGIDIGSGGNGEQNAPLLQCRCVVVE